MDKNSKIYIAGHGGMVGNALISLLKKEGYNNIVTKTSKELDLRNQQGVENFFEEEQPEYVFLLAAKVGGIKANISFPAEFLYDNLMIEANIIHSAYKFKTKKMLFLGSSCIYPRECAQPMKEEYLLTGRLEPTNEGYALAKIAGIKLCETYREQYGCNFISLMPPNLYGPGDNFNPETSHVISALIRRFHEAKIQNAEKVVVWGSGNARREFLYVEDLASAILFFMKNYSEKGHINVGTGDDVSIRELAKLIKEIVGYSGAIEFDTTKPDGMPQKLMDNSQQLEANFKSSTKFKQGLDNVYQWALKNSIL